MSFIVNPPIFLETPELCAELLPAGRCYRGARYDWTGIIAQVTLRNKHTFFSREVQADGSFGMGGRGMAGVFVWDSDALYDAAGIAEPFPMLGIGLVKKEDAQPFQFARPYEVISPYPRETTCGDGWCRIQTSPLPCRGIALRETKELSVSGPTLTIRMLLANCGENPIHAAEFNHNFFAFDGCPIGNDYQLTFPFPLSARFHHGTAIVGCRTVRPHTFDCELQSTSFWIDGYDGQQTLTLRLENQRTGTGVLIEHDFPPCRFYIWSNSTAFCPEVFCKIDLLPHQCIEYQRRYTFYEL